MRRGPPHDIHELKLLARASTPVRPYLYELQRTKYPFEQLSKRVRDCLSSVGKESASSAGESRL